MTKLSQYHAAIEESWQEECVKIARGDECPLSTLETEQLGEPGVLGKSLHALYRF